MRSDNDYEYISNSFKQFMSFNGILYQTLCAYTPQQNGIADHKNRYLIETTRTFLIHGGVPQHFGVMLFLLHVILLSVCHFQF